jgi:Flp pilus assembly protein TadD
MNASKSTCVALSSRLIVMVAAAIAVTGCGLLPPSIDAGHAASAASAPDQINTGQALRIARASRVAGDFASSINLYRSVVAAKPDDSALIVEMGDTLVEAGLADDAIDVYGRIDKTSDARFPALLGLTRAYLAISQPAKALQYSEEAVALAPQDTRAAIARGVSLDMLDRHSEAQAAYRAVLLTTPRDMAARNDLALSLTMTGQLPEALAIIEPMARSPSARPQTRQNLALIYGLMGDDGRAAAVSRMDLDDATTAANLSFFARVRSSKN